MSLVVLQALARVLIVAAIVLAAAEAVGEVSTVTGGSRTARAGRTHAFTARVVRVHDGDTITVRTNNRNLTLR